VNKKAVKKKDKELSGEMGIIEHLSELRKRIFVIVVVFLTVTVIGFNFCDDLVALLVKKANGIGYEMIYISPGELFTQYIRLAVVGGIVLSSPVILFETWLFVKPALMKNEKTIVFLALMAGLLCFICIFHSGADYIDIFYECGFTPVCSSNNIHTELFKLCIDNSHYIWNYF
jgi:sec-independent protein translocase protein TatC